MLKNNIMKLIIVYKEIYVLNDSSCEYKSGPIDDG